MSQESQKRANQYKPNRNLSLFFGKTHLWIVIHHYSTQGLRYHWTILAPCHCRYRSCWASKRVLWYRPVWLKVSLFQSSLEFSEPLKVYISKTAWRLGFVMYQLASRTTLRPSVENKIKTWGAEGIGIMLSLEYCVKATPCTVSAQIWASGAANLELCYHLMWF